MPYNIPSTQELQQLLKSLKHAELIELAEQAAVPLPTLLKIRHSVTKNPGLDTVRKIIDTAVMSALLIEGATAKVSEATDTAALEVSQELGHQQEVANG